jgi:Zn-finger nucleic acid-binding protein
MHKCPQCKITMETRGEISDEDDIVVYQCPKCKNVELNTAYSENQFRMSYP